MLSEYTPNIDFMRVTWREDVTCFQHMHYNIEIVLVYSGTLHMTLAGEALALEAGEALLIAPYILHSYAFQTPHTVCIMECPPEYMPSLFELLKTNRFVRPVIRMHETLRAYLWHMLPVSAQKTRLPIIRAQAVLMPLCEAFYTGCPLTPADEQYSDTFIKAMRLVSYNFHKPISLDSIASQVGIRRETLIRQFRRQTGSTFWDYVLTLRTIYAITLMRRGKPLTDAAYDAGFGSIRSFNRVFLAKTGMTPTAFLKNGTKEDSYLYAPEFPWLELPDRVSD